jgi:hypothetical protein
VICWAGAHSRGPLSSGIVARGLVQRRMRHHVLEVPHTGSENGAFQKRGLCSGLVFCGAGDLRRPCMHA